MGNQALQRHNNETAKNREAESAHVRKTIWNAESDSSEEDMGNTILGDVNHPAPIVMAGNSDSTLKTLATLALGGLLGGGGIAAGAAAMYLLNKPEVVQPATPQPGETMNIGLGKLEDYLKAAE